LGNGFLSLLKKGKSGKDDVSQEALDARLDGG
jgi:hypothetical protein